MTAREALLRWARRSTARYPGVRVTDFTGSWRDGLAFSALIHRNRPDLVDWRGARASQPRERLDRVFHVAEREYGVTRLLDPEGNSLSRPESERLMRLIVSTRANVYVHTDFASQVSPCTVRVFSPVFLFRCTGHVGRPFPAEARTVTVHSHPLLPFSLLRDKAIARALCSLFFFFSEKKRERPANLSLFVSCRCGYS